MMRKQYHLSFLVLNLLELTVCCAENLSGRKNYILFSQTSNSVMCAEINNGRYSLHFGLSAKMLHSELQPANCVLDKRTATS